MDTVDAQAWVYPAWPDNSTAMPFNTAVVISWQSGLSLDVESQIPGAHANNMDLILVGYPLRNVTYMVSAGMDMGDDLSLEYNFTNPSWNGTSTELWELNFVKAGFVPSASYSYVRSPRFSFVQATSAPKPTTTLLMAGTSSPVPQGVDVDLIGIIIGSVMGTIFLLLACALGYGCVTHRARRNLLRELAENARRRASETEENVEKELDLSPEAHRNGPGDAQPINGAGSESDHEMEGCTVREAEKRQRPEVERYGATGAPDSVELLRSELQVSADQDARSVHELQ